MTSTDKRNSEKSLLGLAQKIQYEIRLSTVKQ